MLDVLQIQLIHQMSYIYLKDGKSEEDANRPFLLGPGYSLILNE